jgi:hypothetical protein
MFELPLEPPTAIGSPPIGYRNPTAIAGRGGGGVRNCRRVRVPVPLLLIGYNSGVALSLIQPAKNLGGLFT